MLCVRSFASPHIQHMQRLRALCSAKPGMAVRLHYVILGVLPFQLALDPLMLHLSAWVTSLNYNITHVSGLPTAA